MENLNQFGLKELSKKESLSLDGGWWLVGVAIYLGWETLENPVGSFNAFQAGLDGESACSVVNCN